MCKYIKGNKCILGHQCHCHPVRYREGYDDGYFEQDDTFYDPESNTYGFTLRCSGNTPNGSVHEFKI